MLNHYFNIKLQKEIERNCWNSSSMQWISLSILVHVVCHGWEVLHYTGNTTDFGGPRVEIMRSYRKCVFFHHFKKIEIISCFSGFPNPSLQDITGKWANPEQLGLQQWNGSQKSFCRVCALGINVVVFPSPAGPPALGSTSGGNSRTVGRLLLPWDKC